MAHDDDLPLAERLALIEWIEEKKSSKT